MTVYDASDKKIALGSLSAPKPDGEGGCTFPFLIEDVPAEDGALYSVEVSHRGKVSFEEDDSAAIVLTLG